MIAPGEQRDNPASIDVVAIWTTPSGAHAKESTFFDRDGKTWVITKTAPDGMYLDKDFWVVFKWYDANGLHIVSSDTARCRV